MKPSHLHSVASALAALAVVALVACRTTPSDPISTPDLALTGTSASTLSPAPIICPTNIPGTSVSQRELKPADEPPYPNAQNAALATAILTLALETPDLLTIDYYSTWRIVSFTTSDPPETVFSFYRDNLTKLGWQLQSVENSTSAGSDLNSIHFGWSVHSTVYAASSSNPCAPTPEHGLPALEVEIRAIRSAPTTTNVTIRYKYYPGR